MKKKSSIFNKFFIICQNIMKPDWCTRTCWELSNDIKNMARGIMIEEINKQTMYIPS